MTREVPTTSRNRTIWRADGRWFLRESGAYYAIAKNLVLKKYPRWLDDPQIEQTIGPNEEETEGDVLAEAYGISDWKTRRARREQLFFAREYVDGYHYGWHFDTDKWQRFVRRLARFLMFVDRRRAERSDTLAPLLHWRVCHVWEWLRHWAPQAEFGDWSTEIIADAYGGDEAEEKNARTGCVGCPLAELDTALDVVVANPLWSYLAPLKRLRPLWRELRLPAVRLRKRGLELRKDGTPASNPQRMGPILLDRRLEALEQVLVIQRECNDAARAAGRPLVDMLNAEEEARVRELIALGTWPDGWDGDEPVGDELLEKVFADGSVQPLLPVFTRGKP